MMGGVRDPLLNKTTPFLHLLPMKKLPFYFASLVLFPVLLGAQDVIITSPVANNESAEQRADRLKWFQEARFGMFVHWGVYAVPAGEWHGQDIPGIGEWIMKRAGIPIADYKKLGRQFTASKYDPKAWAALAKEAGMKYVVITSKHHDGFALYDSAVSDWNSMKASAAKRDLIAPLAEAVRAEGLKFGLYYSQAQDWTHRGGAINGLKEGDPGWDPAHKGNFDEYLNGIALPQVKEILTRYHPAVIWWDTPNWMTTERARPLDEALRQLAPGIISNNRLGGGYPGDTKTPEQNIPPRGFPGETFEVCMTMNDTWGFKKKDQHWKSVRQIIRNLSDISSKGGNFLLNVGPTAEGEIPAASIDRLKAVGRWMAVNSEAIHATQASPFPRRLPWGRVTRKADAQGGETLYLHVWDWPKDGRIRLDGLKDSPRSGHLLKGGAQLEWERGRNGIVVTLPGNPTDEDISVAALNFEKPVSVEEEACVTPGNDGRISLSAVDADCHGGLTGNLELATMGDQSYLANWSDASWRVEYHVKCPKAGLWAVCAEIACQNPVKLLLPVKKGNADGKPIEVPASGGLHQWAKAELGTLELPAGESSFEIHGVKEGWSTINLRRVWLRPVK